MSALGLGAILFDKYKEKIQNKLKFFVHLELTLSFTALFGILFIFFLSSWVGFGSLWLNIFLQILSFAPVFVVGILSGVELPLLVSMYKPGAFAQVLGVDYFGSLAGTLVFALWFYPELGMVLTILVVAFLNALSAFAVGISVFSKKDLLIIFTPVFLVFILAFAYNKDFTNRLEQWFMGKTISNIYAAYVVKPLDVNVYHLKNTKYQTISEYEIWFNEFDRDLCFNLDRHIQGCNNWVGAYHYGAVYVPMSLFKDKKYMNILILGGGDFIAVDYFKNFDRQIKSIDLVDLDKEFQEYAKKSPLILSWNKSAFNYPKLNVYVDDALAYLRKNSKKQNPKKYDLVLIDLPGLKHTKLLPLYSKEFYSLLQSALKDDGVAVSWIYPKMERFSEFNEILEKTLYDAGFKNRLIYSALRPELDAVSETETFMLLAKKPGAKISPTNFYTKKFQSYYGSKDWESIKNVQVRANSIFTPNLSMIIKDYAD